MSAPAVLSAGRGPRGWMRRAALAALILAAYDPVQGATAAEPETLSLGSAVDRGIVRIRQARSAGGYSRFLIELENQTNAEVRIDPYASVFDPRDAGRNQRIGIGLPLKIGPRRVDLRKPGLVTDPSDEAPVGPEAVAETPPPVPDYRIAAATAAAAGAAGFGAFFVLLLHGIRIRDTLDDLATVLAGRSPGQAKERRGVGQAFRFDWGRERGAAFSPSVIQISLPDGCAAALAALAREVSYPYSPLRGDASGDPRVIDSIQDLAQAGWIVDGTPPSIREDLRPVVSVLARPEYEVTVQWGAGATAEARSFFAAGGAPGGYVSIDRPGGTAWRVAAWLGPGAIAAVLKDAIGFDRLGNPPPADQLFSFSHSEAFFFLAMVDLHQRESFRSLIERRTLDALAFTSADLGRIVREGVSSADARWWLTVGWVLPSGSHAPAGIDSRAAQRFEQAGWIAADGTGWRMTPSFMRLLDGFVMPSRYAVVRAVDHRTAGEASSAVSLVETPRSFWMVEWKGGDGEPSVAIRPAAEADVHAALVRLAGAFSPGLTLDRPASAARGPAYCPGCGTVVAAQHRFCAHCGRPRQAAGDADRP